MFVSNLIIDTDIVTSENTKKINEFDSRKKINFPLALAAQCVSRSMRNSIQRKVSS